MKLLDFLSLASNSSVNNTAIVTQNRRYSFSDITSAVIRMINILTNYNMSEGNSVMLIADHDENALFFYFAASAIGLQVLLPYNLQDTAYHEWVNIIQSASPDHVIYLKNNIQPVTQLQVQCHTSIKLINKDILDTASSSFKDGFVPCNDEIKNFLILFTSGTTGKPKAICISERLIAKKVVAVSSKLKFNASARIFMSGLMNNTTGILFSLGAFINQSTLVFPESLNPAEWPSVVQKNNITHMMLRPMAMKAFVESAHKMKVNLACVKVVAYGAATVSLKVLDKARELMPCEWLQGYGLSETFGPFCWLDEEDHKNKILHKYYYCIGKPDDTVEMALVFDPVSNTEIGEIVVRSDYLMEGYYDVSSKTVSAVTEYLHTGDYASQSAEGYFILKGRIANTIMSKNGHRIYPQEVEQLAEELSEVDEAFLVTAALSKGFEKSPILILYGDFTRVSTNCIKDTILNKFNSHLSQEKWPEYIYLSNGPLPVSQNGKPDKHQALAMINLDQLITLMSR